jgi:1,2-diacylglycerol 3-beta-galactosyltransferase
MTKTIELYYIDAGGGHRSAAAALHEVMKVSHPQWQVSLVNLFDDVLRPLDPLKKISSHYRAEDIYNNLLNKGWTYGFPFLLRGLQLLIRLHQNKIEELLRLRWQKIPAPDLVVSLIPHFNRALFNALKTVHPNTPYVTVMTDLIDYPPHFWQEKQDQYIVCGNALAVTQAQNLGYSANKILQTSGMILKPHFYQLPENFDRRAERTALGLDADRPTAIIMFGAYSSNTAHDIVRRLGRSNLGVQNIVMCGRNEKLYNDLKNKKFCHPVGFTTDGVPHYMALADFFIGKPGPGSISEALHMGLPVITEYNSRTMPQERYNTVWLREQELGIIIKSYDDVGNAVHLLLTNDNLERLRRNTQRLTNRAVFEVPGMFEQIISRENLWPL